MSNARENLLGLWQARKGLIMLLFAGGAICLLAAVAPQAWATPGQKPLFQSIPDVDGNKDPPACERQCDGPIFLTSMDDGFGAGVNETDVPVYITDNITWTKDVTNINNPPVNVRHTTSVTIVNGHFDPNPVLIWPSPVPGFFDVFFDVNGNDEFNDGDFILGDFGPTHDLSVGAYICVVPCPVGGATVPAGSGVRPLWFALAALIGLGAGAVSIWRRRRGSA